MQLAPRLALVIALLPITACSSDDGNTESASAANDEVGGSDSDTSASTTNTDASTTSTTNTDASDDPTSTTEGPTESYCAHQCSSDADCLVNGQDLGLSCEASTCTSEVTTSCTNDEECVALLSGWSMPCTSGGGECDPLGQLCVQTSAGGRCATPPSDFFMCDLINFAEVMIPDIDGQLVTVCAQTNAECSAQNYCFSPCHADADCASAAYPICNTNTGLCGCGSDSDCATIGQPQLSSCNAGLCGCASDQQCVEGNAGDLCTSAGFCGCTDDAACANVTNSYDGGMIVCVGG